MIWLFYIVPASIVAAFILALYMALVEIGATVIWRRITVVASSVLLLTPSLTPAATILAIPMPLGVLIAIGLATGTLSGVIEIALTAWKFELPWALAIFFLSSLASWRFVR